MTDARSDSTSARDRQMTSSRRVRDYVASHSTLSIEQLASVWRLLQLRHPELPPWTNADRSDLRSHRRRRAVASQEKPDPALQGVREALATLATLMPQEPKVRVSTKTIDTMVETVLSWTASTLTQTLAPETRAVPTEPVAEPKAPDTPDYLTTSWPYLPSVEQKIAAEQAPVVAKEAQAVAETLRGALLAEQIARADAEAVAEELRHRIAETAAAPPQSREPEWIDLKSEPPSLPRFLAKAGLHRATTPEIDACIEKIAELDGGQTDRPTIRRWGRYWLRQYKLADTTQDSLVKRFEDPEHERRRRPAGNPQFREGRRIAS